LRLLRLVPIVLVLLVLPVNAFAQETPPSLVESYSALADSILALKSAETSFVHAVLAYHLGEARRHHGLDHPQQAASEMALFANEGDNAVAGIRKRLLDGGHHHHADAEAEGIYEPGYVVVTREAKATMLAAAAAMRQAQNKNTAQAAWQQFMEAVRPLMQNQE